MTDNTLGITLFVGLLIVAAARIIIGLLPGIPPIDAGGEDDPY